MWENGIPTLELTHKKCLMRIRNSEMEKTPEKPSAQIIKGPWKKRKVKIPNEAEKRLREEIEFAEDIIEQIVIDTIHTLSDNGYDVQGTEFICDMAFITESLRSTIYKEVGLKHPLNDVMSELIVADIDDANKITTTFNIDKTTELLEILQDDEEPEIS